MCVLDPNFTFFKILVCLNLTSSASNPFYLIDTPSVAISLIRVSYEEDFSDGTKSS